MKIYQKVIIAIIICAIAISAILWIRRDSKTTQVEGQEAIPVEAVQAKSGSILRRLTAAGTLTAIQSVTLRPEVSGKIAKIFFKEGEQVQKGDPLYKIDDSIYKAKMSEAEAQFALKKEEYGRATKLLEKGFGTPQLRDRALAEMKVAEAQVEEARVHLNNTVIKAPFEGVMGLSKVSVGATVSESVELVNLVDLDPINVDFHVPEAYLPNVHTGDIVDVTIEDFDILPVEAKVKAISPEIEETTRTVAVRAEMANTDLSYRPGEFARVMVLAGKIENAVLIPESTLEREGEEEYVKLVIDGVAVRTTVSTGMRDGDEVQITHGVKAGDWVISAGQFKVNDGELVKIVKRENME